MTELQVIGGMGRLEAARRFITTHARLLLGSIASPKRVAQVPRALGVLAANPWDDVVIMRNENGTLVESDYTWLFEKFGPVGLTRAEPTLCLDGKYRVLRLVGVEHSVGPAILIVTVIKEDNTPWENFCMARHWPGAPTLPSTPPETIRWEENAVYGFTNAEGKIGYGYGGGDYYVRYDTQAGVTKVFGLGINSATELTAGGGIACDLIDGLGMLTLTEHECLHPIYQLFEVDGDDPEEPEEPEEPSGETLEAILAEVKEINERLVTLIPPVTIAGTITFST